MSSPCVALRDEKVVSMCQFHGWRRSSQRRVRRASPDAFRRAIPATQEEAATIADLVLAEEWRTGLPIPGRVRPCVLA